jgi:hypothetical protein
MGDLFFFTAEKKRYAAIRRGSARIAAYLFFSAVKLGNPGTWKKSETGNV